ncbi:MAG: Flp pilus assembly protein CpaB [Alphaproteobacteria bacterium]|nr:Flp pilus assembly protein CpaB [Alphaproteobacteria bacterium]
MRGRTVILFVIAALLAGGTAMLVRSLLAQRAAVVATNPLVPPPVPQKTILVTAVPIVRGQILKPADLVWRPWPDNAIVPEFILSGGQSEKSFAGWVAREPFVAGEPIVKAKILAPGDRGFLSAVLRPGMRAVSIAVTQTSDISGFVFPGDRVDVLITLPLPAEGQNGNSYVHKAAQTVLHDIRVIAVDQQLDSKTGQAVVARTVTLEVTPKQSEVVALADEMGKLSLSLRSLVAPARDHPVSVADAGRGLAAMTATDSADSRAVSSFTLDSEVSQLVPKPGSEHNSHDSKVTILRGNGSSGTSAGSQSGS